jgi:hypothetical protein
MTAPNPRSSPRVAEEVGYRSLDTFAGGNDHDLVQKTCLTLASAKLSCDFPVPRVLVWCIVSEHEQTARCLRTTYPSVCFEERRSLDAPGGCTVIHV